MKSFTTGQISKIIGVAPRTVSKWIDSGKLKGIRLPLSKDRRVYEDDLIEFITDNGLKPIGSEGLTQVANDSFQQSVIQLMADKKLDQFVYLFEHYVEPMYRISWFVGDTRLTFSFNPKEKTLEQALLELIEKVSISCT